MRVSQHATSVTKLASTCNAKTCNYSYRSSRTRWPSPRTHANRHARLQGERPEKAQGPERTQKDLIKQKGFKGAIGWYTCKGKAFTFTPPAWATAGSRVTALEWQSPMTSQANKKACVYILGHWSGKNA